MVGLPELWGTSPTLPYAPIVLPVTVSIVGGVYEVPAVPTSQLVALIASGDWRAILPGLLAETDQEEIRARCVDGGDPMRGTDCDVAAQILVARLCGVDQGLAGLRMGLRFAAALVFQWPVIAGRLLARGVDPSSAPLWQVMTAMLAMVCESTSAEDLDRVLQSLRMPFPWETQSLRSSGGGPAPFDRRAAIEAWKARAGQRV